MSHLLTLRDLAPADMASICTQAALLKRARDRHTTQALLGGYTLALLFEKPSLRTRVSFTVAAQELGAHCLYLSPQEVGLGVRESVADVARVLSSYVHAVVIRTFAHATLEAFAAAASVPVINGLTDGHHPCQGLTDLFTISEQLGNPAGRVVAYLGDGNNCAHSLLQATIQAGMHVRIATPPTHAPDAQILADAERQARLSGGSVTLHTDPRAAVAGADVVYTDVWASMGQEAEAAQRKLTFAPYQVSEELVALAQPQAIVLHPLPAHRGEEITDAVLEGPHSRVFLQAENRLHVQKAILLHLLDATQAAQASYPAVARTA